VGGGGRIERREGRGRGREERDEGWGEGETDRQKEGWSRKEGDVKGKQKGVGMEEERRR
jgi:hypothetical protein